MEACIMESLYLIGPDAGYFVMKHGGFGTMGQISQDFSHDLQYDGFCRARAGDGRWHFGHRIAFGKPSLSRTPDEAGRQCPKFRAADTRADCSKTWPRQG